MGEALGVHALLLAAGAGVRFGGDKRLAAVDIAHTSEPTQDTANTQDANTPQTAPQATSDATKVTVLEASIHKYAGVFEAVWVVVRPEDHVIASMVTNLGATPVVAPSAHLGMGHSLASGVEAVARAKSPCLRLFVGLSDMPYVTASTLRQLKEAGSNASTSEIVRPIYINDANTKHWGHPIGWPALYWPELQSMSGDAGARELLREYHKKIVPIPVKDQGVCLDIDHPTDLIQGGQVYLQE